MKLLADKDERFKGLFVKVSIVILLAVIGLTINFLVSIVNKGFFTPKSAIYFVAGSGQDIKIGTPVKLSGFKIGAVSKLDLDDKAQAQVEMLIENRYLPLLKDDAVVSIKKEGVIGDSVLEAKRGTDGHPQLAANAIIRFERAGGLDQIAQDLRDRLYPALDEINQLLKSINDPKGDVKKILGNVRQLTENLQGTHARIDHMLGEIDAGIVNDVRPTLRSVKKSAANAETMTQRLNESLPALIEKTGSSLENLRHTTETIKSTMDHTAPQLSGVIGETRGLMSDTRNIMDSASNSWPLKNMMQPTEQGMVRMDSHD